MSQNKYGKLVLDVLGAVQRSSHSQLEKDLLGAVISLEEHDPEGLGRPLKAIERPAEMPAVPMIAAPVVPAPVVDPASQLSATPPQPEAPATEPAAISAASTPSQQTEPDPTKAETPAQPEPFKA